MSERLVRATSSLLERRTNRRGFLVRTAAVGSAVAIGPVRYLTQPDTAEAAIKKPTDCSLHSRCRSSGYTEFCCSIFDWGKNHCPSYSYVGGWWKCSSYHGLRKCRDVGHRYYVDCNRKPSKTCTCKCARNKCRYYWTCCKSFKYGNCNASIPRTEVVCRVIRCRNPGKLTKQCSTRGPTANKTCDHEASCNCGQCGCRTCGPGR
jgi:hypothetical protein